MPDEKRTARFVCAIAAVFPDGETVTTRGIIEGKIGYEERGTNGFGYDPIFYLPDMSRSTAELLPEEKMRSAIGGKRAAGDEKGIDAAVWLTVSGLRNLQQGINKEKRECDMKILVVSDTHGRTKNLERVLKKVGEIDLFITVGTWREARIISARWWMFPAIWLQEITTGFPICRESWRSLSMITGYGLRTEITTEHLWERPICWRKHRRGTSMW